MAPDTVDEQILELLQANGRLTYKEIASHLGVSSVTILNRIKRLEKENIIKGYTTLIDTEKLGLLEAIIYLKASQSISHPSIIRKLETTGDYNLILFVQCKGKKELNDLANNLRAKADDLKVDMILNG
ncbi:MAG: Lrp/AsnC family transcriptional regulator [Candidatus Woesearchaeota archaeon]